MTTGGGVVTTGGVPVVIVGDTVVGVPVKKMIVSFICSGISDHAPPPPTSIHTD